MDDVIMKTMIIILLVTITQCCEAQSSAKQYLSTNEIYSPEILAQLLTTNDTTELQKVTSLFNWITQNIAYNVKRFENNNSRYAPVLDEEDDDAVSPLKPLYERVAIQVLKRRTAVCGGYANL